MSKLTELAPAEGQVAVESQLHDPEAGAKTVYWHRELPPLYAEPLGEHIVEADSMRVVGNLAHRGDLWDRCYQGVPAPSTRQRSRSRLAFWRT